MANADRPSLLAVLGAADPFQRLDAAFTLAQQGSFAGRDVLLAGLRDPDVMVRAAAAEMLGRIGAAWAVAPLAELLPDKSKSVRNEVIFALSRTGRIAAVPPLLQAMRGDPDPERREDARVALVQLLGPALAERLDQWGEQPGEADAVAAWWAEHSRDYDESVTWRSGRPFSIGDVVAEVQEASPSARPRLIELLSEWTGQSFNGPADWKTWWKQHAGEFSPGRRYFHGRPVDTGFSDAG